MRYNMNTNQFSLYFGSLKEFLLNVIFDNFIKIKQINIGISPDDYCGDFTIWNEKLMFNCLKYLYCILMFELLLYPLNNFHQSDNKKVTKAVSKWKRVRIRLWFGDKKFWPKETKKYTIKTDCVSDISNTCLNVVTKAFQENIKKFKDGNGTFYPNTMHFATNDMFVLQL